MAISSSSRGLRPGVCTSTTRPANPYDGMVIYETDTDKVAVYDVNAWVYKTNATAPDVDPVLNNRNVIINGAMQVAQRGTSIASITTPAYYTADRWAFIPIDQGTWTNSIEADAPTGSGLRNSFKVLCTTADASPAASDVLVLQQRLEGQNVQQFLKGTASAKQFALSFWVKSNVTGTYIVNLVDQDNTRVVAASYSVSASATWEKKTIILPADTTGVFDNDNARSLDVQFYLGAGTDSTSGTLQTTWASTVTANRAVGQTNLASVTSNYWQITGVQLEAGAVATPFEFEDYGTTLEKCQRYYYRITADTTNRYIGNGFNYLTTQSYVLIVIPTTMRTSPSALEQSGTAANYALIHQNTGTPCSAVPTFGTATPNYAMIRTFVPSGLIVGQGNIFRIATTGAYLAWSAEL